MKIGIIGTGVFSVSIANVLAQNTENKIIMWSENKKLVEDYNKTNKVEPIFKDKVFPKNIVLTCSYEEVLKEIDLLLLMTSIPYLENVCKEIKEKIDVKIPICIGTKGIATTDGKEKFAYEIVKQNLKNPLAVFGGPTYAEDVLALDPVAFSVACKGKNTKNLIQQAFDVDNVKIVFTRDYKGVAICGCVKNIYAIGSGILAGLRYKESTLAFYLTTVYKELETILYMYESSLTTLHSLAGFGDLMATCSSIKSRNYSLGLLLGKNRNKKEISSFIEKNTIEGYASLESIVKICTKKHIKTPIITAISKIIQEEEKPEYLLEVIKNVKLNSIY